jgi:hypothetical protein
MELGDGVERNAARSAEFFGRRAACGATERIKASKDQSIIHPGRNEPRNRSP